jgi:mRNA-degrading endonuclease YafQ of YafQ-DinJ toxin-antitoxin module
MKFNLRDFNSEDFDTRFYMLKHKKKENNRSKLALHMSNLSDNSGLHRKKVAHHLVLIFRDARDTKVTPRVARSPWAPFVLKGLHNAREVLRGVKGPVGRANRHIQSHFQPASRTKKLLGYCRGLTARATLRKKGTRMAEVLIEKKTRWRQFRVYNFGTGK